LEKERTASNWSFVHILITDGHDTDSNASYENTVQMLSTLRNNMNVRDLKIVILGIDIEYSYSQQLMNLAMAAGIHGEYNDITHTDIAHMFQRIRNDIGMGQRIYQQGVGMAPNYNQMNMNVNTNNINGMGMMNAKTNVNGPVNNPNNLSGQVEYYAVLFTLDISGSMSGHKWDVCRHAVVDFTRYLGNNDLVSAIVFNDYPHLVMHWSTRQNQMRLNQMESNQPFQQVMNY